MTIGLALLVLGALLIIWHMTVGGGDLTYYSGWISIIVGMLVLARGFLGLL